MLPSYDFRGCWLSPFMLRPLEPLMQLIPVAELVLQLISYIGVIEVNGSILLSILKVLDDSVWLLLSVIEIIRGVALQMCSTPFYPFPALFLCLLLWHGGQRHVQCSLHKNCFNCLIWITAVRNGLNLAPGAQATWSKSKLEQWNIPEVHIWAWDNSERRAAEHSVLALNSPC